MEDISVSMIAVTLWETLGWLSVIAVAVGFWALFVLWRSLRRARRRRLGAMRLLLRGLVVMLIAAAIITPFVPLWTMAPFAGLYSVVDVLCAYAMSLAPAAVIGILWVYFGSLRKSPAAAMA